jgi:N-glycosylase/DNA lyase
MKHARLRRETVPAVIAAQVIAPGETARLPVRAGEALDLETCFRSGQIFRWRRVGESWYGPLGNAALALTPEAGRLRVEVAGEAVALGAVYRFLALDAPVARIRAAIATDRFVRAAVAGFGGLRLLRQEPWECLATYVCSQWNNIPKIEASTERIARSWGTIREFTAPGGGVTVACFPRPKVLAARAPEELRACALGYRCGYLVDTARRVAEGAVDLEALRSLDYETALEALLALPGVGRKVADCVLLFSLDKWEACPVDVWVRRVFHELYGAPLARRLPDLAARTEKGLSPAEYRALVDFAWERWGALAGWAQEYLFCARRAGVM